MSTYQWSDSDDGDEANDDEWREYHERCSKEGDGWSHGFAAYDWSTQPWHKHCKQPGPIDFVHEPREEVVKHFAAENWSRMGDAISCNPALKYVDLSKCGLDAERVGALFGGGRSYANCPLEKLVLTQNPLRAGGMSALRPFLRSRSELVHLGLNRTELDAEGARLLSEALDHVKIYYLHVRDNDIGDEGVERILSAANSKHVVELSLTENVIGPRGYDAISRFVRRDDTEIKKLLFNCADGEAAKRIVDSISNKSKLQDIYLWSGVSGRDNETVIAALPNVQRLVCDTSSLEALCGSNHNMMWLGINTDAIVTSNPTIRKSLDINARALYGTSMIKIVRCKLRNFYFRGEYCVHPFARMDPALMPRVLELVTRTEACRGKGEGYLQYGSGTYEDARGDYLHGVYRLIRNCHLPELFSYSPAESNAKIDADAMGLTDGRICGGEGKKEAPQSSTTATLDKRKGPPTMEDKKLPMGIAPLSNKRHKK